MLLASSFNPFGAVRVVDGPLQLLAAKYNYTAATAARSIATVLGVAMPAGARTILIQTTAQAIRMTADGATTPTASIGFLLPANTLFWYSGPLAQLSLIEASATASINVEVFG